MCIKVATIERTPFTTVLAAPMRIPRLDVEVVVEEEDEEEEASWIILGLLLQGEVVVTEAEGGGGSVIKALGMVCVV